MRMNYEKAVKMAVKAMKEQIKTVSFDANMHDQYRADYPLAVKSSKTRADYLEAIRVLENTIREREVMIRQENE